jgi:hypothetical protein
VHSAFHYGEKASTENELFAVRLDLPVFLALALITTVVLYDLSRKPGMA